MQDVVFFTPATNLFIQIFVFVWLGVLTAIVIQTLRHFRQLSRDVGKDNLITILEKVLEKEQENSKNLSEVFSILRRFEKEERVHVQKVGLVRFNPFKELGGDHSFALALLDANENGVIITGLHTRERTRVYVKSIKTGKGELELSEEEKKALSKAQRVKD